MIYILLTICFVLGLIYKACKKRLKVEQSEFCPSCGEEATHADDCTLLWREKTKETIVANRKETE